MDAVAEMIADGAKEARLKTMHNLKHALIAPGIFGRDREDSSRSRQNQPFKVLISERMSEVAGMGVS